MGWNMKNFETVDEFLMKDHHPDTWADLYSGDAEEMLEELSDEEWEELHRVWRLRPAAWQDRLLDILGEVNPEGSVPILSEMVDTCPFNLSIKATITLNAMRDHYTPSRETLKLLRRQLEMANHAFEREALESMIAWAESGT